MKTACEMGNCSQEVKGLQTLGVLRACNNTLKVLPGKGITRDERVGLDSLESVDLPPFARTSDPSPAHSASPPLSHSSHLHD